MFEVNVKNVMEGRRREEGGDQLGFGVLISPFFYPVQVINSEH